MTHTRGVVQIAALGYGRVMQALGTVKTLARLPQLLRSGSSFKVELGSGPFKGQDGWITIDRSYKADLSWDLRWPLPLPDNSAVVIYTSHVLEHFTYPEILQLLARCRRVLKPGGVVSVCVPDASIYLRAYTQPEQFDHERFLLYRPAVYSDLPIDIVNYIAYLNGHHKHMFDQQSLLAILTRAGFVDARPRAFDPDRDIPERRHESLYAVARKP